MWYGSDMARMLGAAVVVALVAAGCGGDGDDQGTTVRMDFARVGDFWAAPLPSDDLRRPDGTIAIENFPNPETTELTTTVIGLVARSVHGFATTGGAFFALTGPIDPATLPDLAASVTPAAQVFLIGVDASAPDAGKRYPVEVAFRADGGEYGADNFLSLVPLQGVPLRPATRYAAVVLRGVHDAAGHELGRSAAMAALAAGKRPTGMSAEAFASYQAGLAGLRSAGVDLARVAGLAVFTTDDPTAQLRAFLAHALTLPRLTPGSWQANEVFTDYCVYSTTISMPDFQSGTPPFEASGGEWKTDATGKPLLARMNEANLVVTIPRVPAPTGGYPTTVFVRTGGGGNRPLVDRGVHGVAGGPELVPGSGPAQELARVGYAGVSVDGPLGGRRNITMGDEQFLVFNVFNPPALRDTIRQSALELGLMAHLVGDFAVDTSACPGAGATARFNAGKLTLMGHSTGAWISGLVLAIEPLYRAAVLSGFGGSFLENALWKKKPIDVLPAIRLLLNETDLFEGSPVLTLLQWGAESADPQVYARSVVREPLPGAAPRHILMEQGIVDHYILPRIANATSLALGLDLAGTPLDGDVGVEMQPPLMTLLGYSGGKQLGLPASANVGSGASAVTAVVVQHPSDGLEDGHEVLFQTEAPKREYRCFLQSLLTGVPRVPAPGTGPCE